MKKTRIIPVVVLATALGLAACSGEPDNSKAGEESQTQESGQTQQEAIKITGTPKTVWLGDTFTLTASVEGVTWASDNEAAATVDASGKVTAVGAGAVKIKASKEGYKDGTASFTVQLVRIKITAAGDKSTLLPGETVQLSADQQGVTWKSSDETVATVSNTGLVSALKAGTASISAEKEGFNTGNLQITVTRPAANLKIDMVTDADHYSADGWWSTTTTTFGMSMETGGGATPVTQTQSWSQDQESDLYIGAFGTGDKETVKFTSNKAGKAELVVNMGNSDALTLSEAVVIKLNDKAISLEGIALEAHEGQSGNELVFADVSLGEQDIKQGENTLVFEMLNETAPSLNEISVYAGDATLALVAPAVKQTITVETDELKVVEGETVQIKTETAGVTYVSSDVSVVSVNEQGLVSGVKVGRTNVTVKKEGMYSCRLTVIVIAKAVAGQILVEAEDAAEVVAGTSGYTKSEDGGASASNNDTHSGSAYISAWQGEEETLTYTFQAEKAGTYALSVTGSAPVNFMGGDSAPFVFADSTEITVNEVKLETTAEFPAPEGYSATMSEVTLGDVTLKAGENTLVVKITGSFASLDCFKLTLKA